jgi:hypothetical protein
VEEAIAAKDAAVLELTGTEQSTAEEAVAAINTMLADMLVDSGVEAEATEQTTDLIAKIPDIPNYSALWNARTYNGTNYYELFRYNTLEHAPYIDFSQCTNAEFMFRDCSRLRSVSDIKFELPIKVTGMFMNCPMLEAVPDINWEMVTGQIQSVFDGCKSLKQLSPVISVADSGSYNGTCMFKNCEKLEAIELTCALGSITEIVYGCTSLRSLKLTQNSNNGGMFGGFGVVTPFYNCTSLTDLELNINPAGRGLAVANWSFQHSPLNLKSATRFIIQLTDVSGTSNAFKYTITFSEHTWALLDADGNNSPNNNTWREYLIDKGWNV